jgi:hypothetical protein
MLSSTHAIEAMYATGHWLLFERRVKDAGEVFRLMVLNAPSDERSWLGLGATHEALGQHGIASELYRLALTLGPFARCALARARALMTLGHVVEGDEAFETALTLCRETDESELESMILAERGES